MSTYDQTPYASYPYPQTHPDRLAAIAGLLGLKPADVRHARVLELGCCSGGNLIPMAEQLPEASFVGLDASGGNSEHWRVARDRAVAVPQRGGAGDAADGSVVICSK